MSGRLVKRLLKQQENDLAGELEAHSEESDEENTQSSSRNVFDLLGDKEETGETDEDDSTVAEDGSKTAGAALNGSHVSSKAGTGKEKNKRKKKKGKGKSTPTVDVSSTEKLDEDESVDRLLEQFAAASSGGNHGQKAEAGSVQQGVDSTSMSEVLSVDTRYLKAEDELRRIFGSKVINSVNRRQSQEAAPTARRRQAPAMRGTRRPASLRKHLLVQPLDHWPRWEAGLAMEFLGTKDGSQLFRYKMSEEYSAVQRLYDVCVSSHDPNSLVRLVANHPYHADSLLALAEVYKQMGEFQTAADLLERCLYSLECAWHPWFTPERPNCRLEYEESNRALFCALFRHMQHLGRRGCHRTALEVSKLLLGLDPSDPMGVLFCIDYYALRANQYAWLEKFVAEYTSDRSLGLFPNFAFSLSLARFYLEHQDPPAGRAGSTSEEGRPQGDRVERAEEQLSSQELLKQALLLHPTVLGKIVAKAPVKVDGPWAQILKHKIFTGSSAGGPSLEHLVALYVERNSMLWRAADVQALLRAAAQEIVELAKRGSTQDEAATWAAVRKAAFPSDTNEYRHLFLQDFSDAVSTLPPEEIQAMQEAAHGQGGGVLPRAEALLAVPREAGEVHQDAAADALNPQGQNILVTFFQAMLPWNNFGVNFFGGDPHGPETDRDNVQDANGDG